MRLPKQLFTIVGAGLLSQVSQAEIRYKVIPIGKPAGMENSVYQVFSGPINDRGEVAGSLIADGNLTYAYEAPYIYRNGQVTILPNKGKNFAHAVTGINNLGVACGSAVEYWVAEKYVPQVWDSNGRHELPAKGSARAQGISDGGVIVGTDDMLGFDKPRAVSWVNGLEIPLSMPDDGQGDMGKRYSYTNAISPDGRVIVGSAMDSSGNWKPTLWRNGVPEYIGDDTVATAYEVTNSGDTCGYGRISHFWVVPYITFNGVVTHLNKLDRLEGVAGGMNEHGQAVGTVYDYDYATGNMSRPASVLWDKSVAVDLNTVTAKPPGLNLTGASDINNNGWISGTGVNNGKTGTYILVPVPESRSMIVIATGLMCTLVRSRRKRM